MGTQHDRASISPPPAMSSRRPRGHFWDTRPGPYLVAGSAVGLGVTTLLALGGILMPAVRPALLLEVAGAGAAFYVALDWLKVRLFARLDLR